MSKDAMFLTSVALSIVTFNAFGAEDWEKKYIFVTDCAPSSVTRPMSPGGQYFHAEVRFSFKNETKEKIKSIVFDVLDSNGRVLNSQIDRGLDLQPQDSTTLSLYGAQRVMPEREVNHKDYPGATSILTMMKSDFPAAFCGVRSAQGAS